LRFVQTRSIDPAEFLVAEIGIVNDLRVNDLRVNDLRDTFDPVLLIKNSFWSVSNVQSSLMIAISRRTSIL
jgi:hypothetical protein